MMSLKENEYSIQHRHKYKSSEKHIVTALVVLTLFRTPILNMVNRQTAVQSCNSRSVTIVVKVVTTTKIKT
jgi:hypothetical protein